MFFVQNSSSGHIGMSTNLHAPHVTSPLCCPHNSIWDVACGVTEMIQPLQPIDGKLFCLYFLRVIPCPLFEHPEAPRCILG